MKALDSFRYLPWCVFLMLNAGDALAWGLYTHVWFAQALLWLVPLADPHFSRAVKKFPRLLLAGACLPDLTLVRGLACSEKFADSHDWQSASALLQSATRDEDRALALGFASHLLTDIFAHNHFVPAHENVWLNIPLVTHVSCEWALDHHVRRELFATPGQLLLSEEDVLMTYLGSAFGCEQGEATRLLKTLGKADRFLRGSGIPRLTHGVGRLLDQRMQRRFKHYLWQTVQRLPQINALIAGELPQWHANPARHLAHEAIAGQSLRVLRSRLRLPTNVFESALARQDVLCREFGD